MSTASVKEEIGVLLTKLPPAKQRAALAYVRQLSGERPKGVPGSVLLKFAGCISKESADAMEKAIEDGCEQVDPDGW